MDRLGVEPLHVQFFDRGERLWSFSLVEDIIDVPIADRVEHHAVLVAQNLFLLLVGESGLSSLVGIGSRALADAASAHEDLRLQEKFVLTRLTLHVKNRILMLDIGIEPKDHVISLTCSRVKL